ncbi:polymorphic toxin-type HINT domain-containing protein [Streptomyces sp. NBC_00690]|uniref:polymorphic toxin-type HINT domain-containing protein n=1 Tax=Streptomyces sp. NBC_00690 TaxID=2975808 RepID=UPI002E27ABE4|nr:polymorphic toxin-type HINT domain-containing protein [Streptomyces sp. NBC_00690]
MTNGRSRTPFRRIRGRIALACATVMVGTLLQAVTQPQPAAAADKGTGRPSLPASEKPIPGTRGKPAAKRTTAGKPPVPLPAPDRTWPKAATARIALATTTAGSVKATGLPLELDTRVKKGEKSATGTVQAEVVSRKAAQGAGVDGVMFTLRAENTASEGTVRARVDYSTFADAYGGGYADRLTLVQLPPCALTTPSLIACRTPKPVAAVNDTEQRTLTAPSLELAAKAPTVFAAVSTTDGSRGDYKATSLSASATWNTNLNTGDFSWSYNMPVPEVPGSLLPNVGLSYSSGSVDGRTANTNNQSSWAGDGFSMWPGFIERRYKPCADDGIEHANGKPGDLCWGYDNAFISFNGKAGELVPTGANTWKLRDDDGTKIDRLTSANRANGDNDGEYWRLTAPNGTRYYFGYHRLPGWAEGKEATDSTWTVPVFGDDTDEPCKAVTFAASHCQQAWRWNLDYVVDVHSNAMAYYYHKESNSYGRNLEAADNSRYTRGGALDRIEYGLKSSSMYGTKALARVDFTNSERCVATSSMDCSSIDTQSAYWYDTPWDLNCDIGETCDEGRLSPSFFTRKRLSQVTTQVLEGTAYQNVDSWKLAHHWGMADTDYQLLLSSIQHTGHTATPAITQPKTTFGYTQLANRLDRVGDGFAPFIKARLSTVINEAGGQLDANYTAAACDADALPTPSTNTTRCFPQFIGGSDTADPVQQWFNKYTVASVTESDRTGGGAPDKVTRYDYLGGAAWHYDDDDGLTKDKHRTWSQWRGYGHVRVQTGGQGGASAMKSQQDSYFLRGMDGDRLNATGGTKNVTITLGTGEGDPLTDHESAAGFAYKTVSYSGPGGTVLSKTVNRPWKHQTASKVRDWGTITANFTGTSNSKTFISLDNGAGTDWRTVSKATTHDTATGLVTEVHDLGNHSTAADNRCIRTSYATNTTLNILTLPARVETVAKPCDTTPVRPADVLSDVRTAYDNQAYGDAPTKGLPTATSMLKEYDGTTAVYLEASGTYDSYGRQVTSTDLTATTRVTAAGVISRTLRTDGRTTTTERTPAVGIPTTLAVTTPPATAGDASTSQTTTTEHDPVRGLPLTQTDTNGKVTSFAYDALGRSTKIWFADRTTSQIPHREFIYTPAGDGQPNVVATKTLGNHGVQRTSYVLYDGMQRPRQTQEPGPGGGTLISDTFYDERGLVAKTFSTYYTTSAPGTQLFTPNNALSVESQTRYTYDGLGRQTEVREIAGNGDGGTVLAVSQTIHGGDRTTVIPPTGGTATTTLVDVRGKTTQLRQHHEPTAGSTYDKTSYTYHPSGQLTKVTDPANVSWNYTYDLMGRQTVNEDPDKGTTTNTYDDRGQLRTTHNDATNITLAHLYDNLGRKTQLRKDSATGPLRAEWTYDTITGAKGHLADSTRYENGNAYTSKVVAYNRLYQPLRTSITIPTAEGDLAGTYVSTMSYNVSGLPQGVGYPAAGSLPGAVVSFTYDDHTLRTTGIHGSQGVEGLTSYSLTGKPLQNELFRNGKKTWVTNGYEWGTQRLSTTRVDREDVPGVDQSNTYRYDDSANILSVTDVSRSGTDNQCFTYDFARRITQAWTQNTTTCAATPSSTVIGGPAPYWHSYTYRPDGNRATETLHDPTGDTTKDRTRTYEYPAAGQPQPHTLTSVTSAGPPGTPEDSFTYVGGNTVSRTVNGTTQNLEWDPEGHLAKVTEPVPGSAAKVTRYLYDAEGNRLIGRTPTETTLYLGSTEITLPKTSAGAPTPTPSATRYIHLGGGHQGVQEDDGTVSFTLADHHGTAQLATNATTQQLTQRRSLPFGGTRGTQPTTWPGTKGFVGGTDDTKNTGLTHLGAREYDPSVGRFISVDPILQADLPQTLNGYTYGAQNPLAFSDPSGLKIACGAGHDTPCPGNDPNGDGVVNPGYPNTNVPTKKPSTKTPIKETPPPAIQIGEFVIPTPEAITKLFTYRKNLSYESNVQLWARNYCSNVAKMGKSEFCNIASTTGYFGQSTIEFEMDILEIIGARDYVDCLTGKGSASCGAAAADVALIIISRGRSKAAEIGFKATKIRIKNKGTKSITCLIGLGNSFKKGTPVLMADGSTKPIEKIKAGDKVLATEPETGQSLPKTVEASLVHNDDDLIDIRVRTSDDKTATISTTAHHLFWDQATNSWKPAGALTNQSQLANPMTLPASVESTQRRPSSMDMYDLTVADFHTYYVLAGETPVLVHNSTPCPTAINLGSRPAGVGDDWVGRGADNGKGIVWQKPGSTGNGDMVRVMDPTGRYPNGYVRFHNRSGQPIGLDGKPGSKADTHISMNPDGTYPLPEGW